MNSLPSEPPGKPKNTGVGSLSLLQGIFPTQESNRGLLNIRRILYQLSYQGNPALLLLEAKSVEVVFVGDVTFLDTVSSAPTKIKVSATALSVSTLYSFATIPVSYPKKQSYWWISSLYQHVKC